MGLNAGLGNFGVTTMQILIPLSMTMMLFGGLGGEPMTLIKDSGWLLGKIVAGTSTYVQNAGFIWAAMLVPLVIAAWFGMNNLLPFHRLTVARWSPSARFCTCGPSPRQWASRVCTCTCPPHRPGLAEHVGGAAADRGGERGADEADGLWPDEGQHRQAVRHLRQQAHLVHDRAVRGDLRLLYRFSMALPLSITVILASSMSSIPPPA